MSTAVLERPVWVSHKGIGTTVYIDEMIDEHLQYTIAMIKRGIDRRGSVVPTSSYNYLPALEAELKKRALPEIIVAEAGWDP
jgi:hypothetical protein